ncbi:MAG: bifunctional riboflavin kinase/FAD synthetase [Alphaproteobacteria bacterium]
MRVFRHHTGLPDDSRGAVVVVGNFDGVHRGHQEVISHAREIARAERLPLAVLTFEPHPRSHFQPDIEPFRLTPFRTKARHLEAMGVEIIYVLHFDEAFSLITASRFVAEILVGGVDARHVVVGYDFRFGHGRAGDSGFLAEEARRNGFRVSIVDPVADPEERVYSSSLIRDLLQRGHPARAAALLGHLWEIEGRVETGDRRGRAIGFPTANIDIADYLRPAGGVYVARAGIDVGAATAWHDGVANLGTRPTVDGSRLLLEVHLFDFAEDLYGRHLRVALVDHLRPEGKFTSLDALKEQIARDCRQARQLLAARAIDAGEVVGAP